MHGAPSSCPYTTHVHDAKCNNVPYCFNFKVLTYLGKLILSLFQNGIVIAVWDEVMTTSLKYLMSWQLILSVSHSVMKVVMCGRIAIFNGLFPCSA